MNTLNTKLEKIINDGNVDCGMKIDVKVISKIKQTILKEIEKNAPKESYINYHIEDGIEYRDQNDIGVSITWEKGFNHAINQYTQAIRKVLGK